MDAGKAYKTATVLTVDGNRHWKSIMAVSPRLHTCYGRFLLGMVAVPTPTSPPEACLCLRFNAQHGTFAFGWSLKQC